jgi:hypothetical protein
MPGYAGNGLAKLLHVNQTGIMWQTEVVPAAANPGSLSVAYQLERLDNAAYPWGASFEVTFASNPGLFNIYIMGANIDNAANYLQIGNISATNNATSGAWVGRWDMPSNQWIRCVAAYMFQLTNAVNVTMTVTR